MMSTAKIAISIEKRLLREIDRLVQDNVFPSRSNAIQSAVRDKINRINRNRLAVECSKLDRNFEQAMAEEGISNFAEEWSEY